MVTVIALHSGYLWHLGRVFNLCPLFVLDINHSYQWNTLLSVGGEIFQPFKSSSSSDLDHHSIWIIITGSGSSLDIITGSGSSLDLDHHWTSSLDLDHHSIRIITAGSSSLDHHGCYLVIRLITGSSTEPTLFHVGCRPSLHVGLLQRLYLTLSQNGPLNTYI